MKQWTLGTRTPGWLTALLCAVLSVLGLLVFFVDGYYRYATIIAGLGMLLLLGTRDLGKLRNWPSLFLVGYVIFSFFTLFWAMSGKFFLQQYYKVFIAFFVYLLVATRRELDRRYARHVMAIIAGLSAIYAFFSVAGTASPALHDMLVQRFSVMEGGLRFTGARIYGIMANSNIEASLFTIGVIFSVALICDSEKHWQRALWAAALSITATGLLLGFSMGALACFAVALVVYLIAAGEGRSALLLRMLEAGIPTLACSFLMMRYFNTDASSRVTLLLLANAAVTVVLELLLAGRLSAALEKRQKLAFGLLIGVVVLIVAYGAAGMQLYGPYTFGNRLYRGAKLDAGEHTMSVQADGDVTVEIYSNSQAQIMAGTATTIYNGPANGAVVTVPEDSYACDLFFYGGEGVTITHVAIDAKEIPLKSKLFPEFAMSRIQTGLSTSSSTILREILWRDGLRLWRLSPVYGHGVGSFETGISRVQDFRFETRYVHNHYIQVLLEDGVIGFAFYAAALLSMLVALWKRRRPERGSAFYWIYPALCAQFTMSGLQMIWDVSMSILVFLCQSYATYGLIVGICADPIPRKERPLPAAAEPPADTQSDADDAESSDDEDAENDGDEDEKPRLTVSSDMPVRALLMVLPIIYIMTICGNIYAAKLLKREFHSYEEAYEVMEKAAELDLYEKNDIKLTYVITSMQDGSQDNHQAQANLYAAELSKVQSNRIPYYLATYYYNTAQYALSIEEAKLGALYSASDSEQWNLIAGLLKHGFIDTGALSPLLTQPDGDALLDALLEYAAMKDAYDAKTIRPLELDGNSVLLFDKLAALATCRGDHDAILAVLNG